LSPKGEFWDRLERALDLSKNVSEPAKNDFRLGNGLSEAPYFFYYFEIKKPIMSIEL
jgi:hypothetical protein